MEVETHTQYQKLEKLFTDMYIGNGVHNPSVTTRLTMSEDKIENLEDKLDKSDRNLNKALWLAATTLLAFILQLAAKFIHI